MTHKLVFIGDKVIHNAFSGMEESWDFQIPFESVKAFKDEIESPNSKIDENTSVIILFSRLFEKEPELFSKVVAFYAPYSVICILTPNAEMAVKIPIEEAVKKAQYAFAERGDYDINTPFFFVSYENVQQEIFASIEEYVRSPLISEEIKLGIKPMLNSLSAPLSISSEEVVEQETETQEVHSEGTGQVISVTSSKGGSGKSTTAVTLGAYIAKASKDAFKKGKIDKALSVCIVDMDTRDGQLGFLTGKTKPTIIDMIENGSMTSFEQIRPFIIYNENLECSLVLAAKRPRSATEISTEIYRQLISTLKAHYDVVILDTSVNYLDPLLENVCYPMSDNIILVSEMVISSIMGCSRWIKEVLQDTSSGKPPISPSKVGVVINKALPNINMTPEKIEKALGTLPIITFVPHLAQTVAYAANHSSLERLLNVKVLNDAFKEIAESIINSPLGEVPVSK